jgi:predicted RecB family nuclease
VRIKPRASQEPRLYQGSRGPVPSVTDILKTVEKPYFDRWRHRVGRQEANKTMKAAQVFGTRLHAAAVLVGRSQMDLVEADMMPFAGAVCDFLNVHVREVIVMERSMVSDRHGFGGTFDLYCELFDGGFAVIDYKTTSSLTREHGLQLAAYAVLCREHGMTVNRRIAVRIKKEPPGKFYARTYGAHKQDVEAFLALKTYYHWAHKNRLLKAA